MSKLLIIGNGFDLAHGLETSYKDYYDSEFFPKELKESTNKENYWCDYENSIGNKIELLIGENSYDIESLEIYSKIEEWEHEAYGLLESMVDESYTVSEKVDNIMNLGLDKFLSEINLFTEELHNYLANIDDELSPTIAIYKLEYEKYITFNYTHTLEIVYSIPDEDVFHIHGDVSSEIMIGYNSYVEKEISAESIPSPEELNITSRFRPKEYVEELQYLDREREGGWIHGMAENIHKNITEEINEKTGEFDKNSFPFRKNFQESEMDNVLENITVIDIFGHSLGEMDWDFLDLLNEKCEFLGITINVFAYSLEDANSFKEIINKRGWTMKIKQSCYFTKVSN